MKPHRHMTNDEIKAYMEYRAKNKLTPEEKAAYREWVIQAEEDDGCDFSVIPREVLWQGQEASDAYYERFLEERRERNAAKTETA